MTIVCFSILCLGRELITWSGGEIPVAFVVLASEAAKRVQNAPEEAENIKSSIIKVRPIAPVLLRISINSTTLNSMLQVTKSSTNT